jgi:hypothetical protein
MKLWGNAFATILLVIGVIWALQGANVIGGSFMTGQATWLYIGIVLVVGSLGIFWWINFR